MGVNPNIPGAPYRTRSITNCSSSTYAITRGACKHQESGVYQSHASRTNVLADSVGDMAPQGTNQDLLLLFLFFCFSPGQSAVAQARDQDPAKERLQRDVLNMVNLPRGLCIIIDNFNYRGSGLRRDGSEKDGREMVRLFTSCDFECLLGTHMIASEMKLFLSVAAQSAHERTDCLVVVLMSHGTTEMIHAADNVPLHLDDDICALFNNENCPGLQGKPKLFFIQACRGGKEDNATGTTAYESADDMAMAAEAPQTLRRERTATWSDMYTAYAMIPGYKAFMNRMIGSWFLSALYRAFTEHTGTMHL